MNIQTLDAYPIFDSRGRPTVEAVITLSDGSRGVGTVPSGASTGQYEALELRDGNPAHYRGKGVSKAVDHILRIIAPSVIGMDASDQAVIDRRMVELDGTPNKACLGANAILAVSMAAANATASAKKQWLFEHLAAVAASAQHVGWASPTTVALAGRDAPAVRAKPTGSPVVGGAHPTHAGALLPLPEIQIFGGGAHAQHRIDIQDFLIIAIGARSYDETLEMTHNVYFAAMDIMKERGRLHGIADEGGFWPDFDSNEQVFETLIAAIERAGYRATTDRKSPSGREIAISLDLAASDLYKDGRYHFRSENRSFSSAEFAKLVIDWCTRYPIISIEDPCADTDWDGWRMVYDALGHKVQIIGDDLFTTNIARIEEGIQRNVANAVLIKLNQIGTVTETLLAIKRTQQAGWLPVISARSGETEDTFISHLAVATNAGQLKVGSFARSERMAKWNEVIRIGRRLGPDARFVGAGIYDAILS